MSENSEGNSGKVSRRGFLKAAVAGVAIGVGVGIPYLLTKDDKSSAEALTEEQQLIKALEQDNNTILDPKINEIWKTVATNRLANMLRLVREYPNTARKFIKADPNIAAREKLGTVIPLEQQEDLIEQKVDNWNGILLRDMESGGAGSPGNNYGFERLGDRGEHIKDYQILEAGQPKPFIPGRNRVETGFAIQDVLLPDPGAVIPIKN